MPSFSVVGSLVGNGELGCGVGTGVGAGVGTGVGAGVGTGVGNGVGARVGNGVGARVGNGVGAGVGNGVGAGVGSGVGAGVGSGVRARVGSGVGARVGSGVGALLGTSDGPADGLALGTFESAVGEADGIVVGGGKVGASVRGAQPQGIERLGRIGQKLSSIKPNSPARAKLRQLIGSSLGTSTMAVGCVMTLPAPQISQTGKPGDGGSGALTGAGVVGVAMVGLGLGGASSQQAAAIAGMTGQKEASMNPCSPAVLSLPQEMGSSFGTSIIRLGCVTIRPSPQMLQAGKPGDGGTGPLTGAGVVWEVTGTGGFVGAGLGGKTPHAQGMEKNPTRLQRLGEMRPF